MELGKEYFGPFWKFITNEEITDVDYNGHEVWLTNIYNERYRVQSSYVEENITPAFVEQFTQRIANVVSRQFNKRYPELEAETSELRVTIVHESVARSGRHRRLSAYRRRKQSRKLFAMKKFCRSLSIV